jgi:hypothetical protein
VDVPPSDVTITGGVGWGVRTRTIVLCDDCSEQLEAWLALPHQTHQDGPGGAIADTAVASMACSHLTTGLNLSVTVS